MGRAGPKKVSPWAIQLLPSPHMVFPLKNGPAQPTHGLHIHLKKVLKDSFACCASESYLLWLTILFFLK
jgi:hypothetical protein